MMAGITEEHKFTLRLIIDEEKNKVVFAEGCRDFVKVLFSLMTLPMGTVVTLLQKHKKSEISCFGNLHKSVADMGVENFKTEACKRILLEPRSWCYYESLMINLNPTDDLKLFKCPSFSRCKLCSNFSGSVCACGELMNQETGNDLLRSGTLCHMFTRDRSAFIITDDLNVSFDSTGLVLETLNSLGYTDVSMLEERLIDIGLEEILNILEYMFSSNTPLTNTFLKTQTLQDVKSIDEVSCPFVGATKHKFTLDAIVRKQDMKILYVECGQDIVDILFNFLAVTLEYLCDFKLGCVGNLGSSFKRIGGGLTGVCCFFCSKCALPYYYKCKSQLSDISTEETPVDYDWICGRGDVTMIDPKTHGGDQSKNGSGFVKEGTRFTVSDDLIITPRSPLTTSFCSLKKLQIKACDLDIQVIKIGEAEVKNMFWASLVTSSALNTALWNLIAKKPKKET